MKKVYITLFLLAFAFSANAQNMQVRERGFMGANPAKLEPQLKPEQQEAIKALRDDSVRESACREEGSAENS